MFQTSPSVFVPNTEIQPRSTTAPRKLAFFTAVVFLALTLTATFASATVPLQCGDVDGNGTVSAADALALLRAAVKLEVTLRCPGCDDNFGRSGSVGRTAPLICGDVDGNGTLVAADALFLLRAAVRIPGVEPLCPSCQVTTTTTTTTTTLPSSGVIDCGSPLPASDETCIVAAGDATMLLRGDVLAPDSVFLGGSVLLDDLGIITCVGCDCAAAGATVVTCTDAVISPALINLHEHLTFTAGPTAPDTGERYEHRHEWRTGSGGHTKLSIGG